MRSRVSTAVVCGLAFMIHGNARAAGGDACIAKTPVKGVGDDAYFIDTPGFGLGLNVKKGSSAFQVKVYGFSPEQIKIFEMTLAQDVLVKL